MDLKKIIINEGKAVPYIVPTFLSALIVGILILRLTELSSKYIFGIVFVLPLAFAFVGDLRKYLLGIFLFLIPISLNIAPFNLGFPSYLLHHGGAQPKLEIWVSQLPFALMFLIWITDIAIRKKKIQFTPIDVSALLFIGWNALSLLYTSRLDLTGFHLLRMIMFYLVYLYIVNNIYELKMLNFVVNILLISLLLQSLLAFAQYWFNLPFSIGGGGMMSWGVIEQSLEKGQVLRVQGTLGWPNTFGLYIAMILPIAFSIWLSKGLKLGKIAFISFCFGLIVLIITFSRGAWIATIISSIIVVYLLHRNQLIRVKVLPVAFFALPVVAFLAWILGNPLYERITASPAAASLDRIKLMQVAWEMIKAHPVTGVGLNTFTEVMVNYDNTGISSYLPLPVHNYFLLVSSEIGFIGLILLITFLGTSFKIGVSCSSRSNRDLSTLAIGAIGALFGALVANFVDCTLRFYCPGLLFWTILSFIRVCFVLQRNNLGTKGNSL